MPNCTHTASWLPLFLGHFADAVTALQQLLPMQPPLQWDATVGCWDAAAILCITRYSVTNASCWLLLLEAQFRMPTAHCHCWLIVVIYFLFHCCSHSHTLSAIADITGNCFLYPTVSSTITAHHSNTWCPFLCPTMLFPLLLCVLLFLPLHLVDFYFKII